MPTTIEAGLPDSDYVYWMGLFAPAKTPPAIIDRLRAETEKALKNPNVVEKFATQGIEPMPLTSARIRRADQEGDRDQRRARESGRAEVQLR